MKLRFDNVKHLLAPSPASMSSTNDTNLPGVAIRISQLFIRRLLWSFFLAPRYIYIIAVPILLMLTKVEKSYMDLDCVWVRVLWRKELLD